MPAFVVKLITSSVALDILGQNYRFKTQLILTGTQKGQMLMGDVYIHGEGDPYISIEDYYDLVSTLSKRNIKIIYGSLIIDDSWFDNNYLGDGWEKNDE